MSQYPSAQALQADVLLVTVTAVETVAVRRLFSIVQRHFISNRTYYDLGEVGGAKVFLVRSEMGAGGQSGAILTIQRAIDTLSPSAIIMVGTAFGVNPEEQKIGDILVSQQILYYELQRVGSGPNRHRFVIISRGDKAAASPKLLNRFRDGAMEWKKANEPAKVKFGLILSGDKLVDNYDFREQLRAFGPDAIGGEMEGAGLYATVQSNKIDWILVKAICDWVDGILGEVTT
jgi:nucleoside phosphorylase